MKKQDVRNGLCCERTGTIAQVLNKEIFNIAQSELFDQATKIVALVRPIG